MKELSIEEKAKRYDEAIEVARKIKNGEPINVPDGTPIPIAIFPELKESEDEKIRKGLLYVIEHHPTLQTEEAEEYIAWLEKQGEQKQEDTGQYFDSPWVAEVAEKMSVYYKQNHACSEEDEAKFEDIRKMILFCTTITDKTGKFIEPTDKYKNELIKRLESLKSRNAKWIPSNAQMDAIKVAINCLGSDAKTARKQLTSLYEDLKKL